MKRVWLACFVSLLAPASAGAVSLVVDRLDTPDVVQAGDRVSFSFAFEFAADELLLAAQTQISAPHLREFEFAKARNPWDLSADFRQIGDDGNPQWVYAENIFGEDPAGVTWEEVGGLAPLGRFSAIATYNGEIGSSCRTGRCSCSAISRFRSIPDTRRFRSIPPGSGSGPG